MTEGDNGQDKPLEKDQNSTAQTQPENGQIPNEEDIPENITSADDFGIRRAMEEELSWLSPDNIPEELNDKTKARIERLRRKHQILLQDQNPTPKRRGRPKNISKFPTRPKSDESKPPSQ